VSIYKRGGVYWYKFMWKGELVRESTKQGNDKIARQMEAARKTALAKGEVGIREKKPAPTLLLQSIWLFRLRPAGRNGGSRSGLVDGSINKPVSGL
jgi:hypothetical protein